MINKNIQIVIGETIAMFVMFTLTTSAVTLIKDSDGINTVLISGLGALAAVVTAGVISGNISGSQANPAVTLVYLLIKKIDVKTFFLYILGQFIGANLAVAFLFAVLNDKGYSTANLGQLNLNDLSVGLGFLTEMILTFLFTTVVIKVAKSDIKGVAASFVNGLALMAFIIGGSELTGPSINPMRSLVPYLYTNSLSMDNIIVYIVGPFVGAILAYFVVLHMINLIKAD